MMRFKVKRSKIIGMQGRKQQGMASIVVVSVLIVIMTLISIGFARLINRSSINSANKQFSASATYAAQSAINDVSAYLKDYATANPGSNFLPKSTKCNGAGSLIGSSGSPGPFYNDSNLSGDTSRSTQYTCLLLDPTPSSLVYTQVAAVKSQVVKINTSASTGALEKLLISWQPSDSQVTGYPVSTNSLNDESTWNSVGSTCKDSGGANASCIPVLRLSIYPISNSSSLSSAQADSKTVYLYPQAPSGTVLVKSFTDGSGFKDGSIIPVPCTQTVGASDFNPSSSTGYKCNFILRSLSSAISPATTDSVYLRMTPLYNQADIRIASNDKFGNSLSFIHDQAVIDATAQTGGVVKRLQARVDTSSLDSSSSNIDTNISSLSDLFPEQAIRTANALCKREVETTSSVDFTKFVNFDAPDNVCHYDTGTITNPVPQLTFTITGQNGKDNGRTVDSEANNPDSPQDPVKQGTVYVGDSPGSNAAARLDWSTIDADSCTASDGSGSWASPAEKNGMMSFSGSPHINGSGNQAFGVTSVTSYSLQCSRPYAPAPTPIKKVTIWPYPTATISGPPQIVGGTNYTVSWSSNNSSKCDLTGNWTSPGTDSNPSGAPENKNQTMYVDYTDVATKTFTVQCYDPVGRTSGPKTVTYTKNPSPGNPCPTGACIEPPPCSASTSASDNQDAQVNYSWSGACPSASPGVGYYRVSSSTDGWLSSTSRSGSGTTPGRRTSQFCLTLVVGLANWGDRNSSTSCATPYPPNQNGNPACTADVNTYDDGNASGHFTWTGVCPPVDSSRGYYQLINCSGPGGWNCDGIGTYPGWVGTGGTGYFDKGPGTYCVQLQAGADPWGWQATSTRKCINIQPPPITAGGWLDLPMFFQASPLSCDSGGHHWCLYYANWYSNDPMGDTVTCQLKAGGSTIYTSTSSSESKELGWVNYPAGESIDIHCTGSYGRSKDAHLGNAS